MTPDRAAIRTYFAKLGLASEIADLYLALHAYGPQTISQLARNSQVERTRIYRLIDQLLGANLIEVETHDKRGIIKAAPITNLNILITQREQELRGLQDELGLIEQVLARNSLSSPVAHVQYYYGPEGVRHMLWSELQTKHAIAGYHLKPIASAIGASFSERWHKTLQQRRLSIRLLTNLQRPEKPPVSEIELRSISARYFDITHSCNLHDDIASYIYWKDGDVFGIEIRSAEFVRAQFQFFEILWEKATPTN